MIRGSDERPWLPRPVRLQSEPSFCANAQKPPVRWIGGDVADNPAKRCTETRVRRASGKEECHMTIGYTGI
jgi:hypothetical protein